MGVATFTSYGTQTWVVPEGVTQATVYCYAKGGNGAPSNLDIHCGGGGGGGGYARSILSVNHGTNEILFLGDPWVWFRGYGTLRADSGGDATGQAGGPGGSGVGQVVQPGGNGTDGGGFGGIGGGGGDGGAGGIGGAGGPPLTPGNEGGFPGGGGGGGGDDDEMQNYPGGAGASAMLVVEWSAFIGLSVVSRPHSRGVNALGLIRRFTGMYRYLLEGSQVDNYLLEDGSGVYLLEPSGGLIVKSRSDSYHSLEVLPNVTEIEYQPFPESF